MAGRARDEGQQHLDRSGGVRRAGQHCRPSAGQQHGGRHDGLSSAHSEAVSCLTDWQSRMLPNTLVQIALRLVGNTERVQQAAIHALFLRKFPPAPACAAGLPPSPTFAQPRLHSMPQLVTGAQPGPAGQPHDKLCRRWGRRAGSRRAPAAGARRQPRSPDPNAYPKPDPDPDPDPRTARSSAGGSRRVRRPPRPPAQASARGATRGRGRRPRRRCSRPRGRARPTARRPAATRAGGRTRRPRARRSPDRRRPRRPPARRARAPTARPKQASPCSQGPGLGPRPARTGCSPPCWRRRRPPRAEHASPDPGQGRRQGSPPGRARSGRRRARPPPARCPAARPRR